MGRYTKTEAEAEYTALIAVDQEQWEADENNAGDAYEAPEFSTWGLTNCDHMMDNICDGIIAARQNEFDAAEAALLSIMMSSIRPKHDLKHIRSCKTGSEAYRLLVSVFSGAKTVLALVYWPTPAKHSTPT